MLLYFTYICCKQNKCLWWWVLYSYIFSDDSKLVQFCLRVKLKTLTVDYMNYLINWWNMVVDYDVLPNHLISIYVFSLHTNSISILHLPLYVPKGSTEQSMQGCVLGRTFVLCVLWISLLYFEQIHSSADKTVAQDCVKPQVIVWYKVLFTW